MPRGIIRELELLLGSASGIGELDLRPSEERFDTNSSASRFEPLHGLTQDDRDLEEHSAKHVEPLSG
jgi:hypothetical protein